ncbi:hypothetical protein BD311DRAFT_792090 [Dichomitus squalens]|uniref:Uncharacterized protein n=1 Tax=Dichomitus squalens TaxID=114155 RepID=A0A4Q9M927_9APHY|nr:hypothetical protein BD311DRAFT_792090 [Dichomitus squalens]
MQSTTAVVVIWADTWPQIGFALQAALGTATPSILHWKTDEWRRRGHTGTIQKTASDVNAVTRHIKTVARMAKLA